MKFAYFVDCLEKTSNNILLIPGIIVLLVSIALTIQTRFVQLRAIPKMLKILLSSIFRKSKDQDTETVKASKALFTAMATTIGVSSITAPIIAVRLGGPGTLVGFMIASFLGGAVTFTEVTLGLTYRKKLPNGGFMGGPMQYLKKLSSFWANWYAYAGIVLLIIFSARQANTVADLLNPYHVPYAATGLILAIFVTVTLIGGIKRVAQVTEKLVPLMFFLYTGSTLWIIFCNIDKLPAVFGLIFSSAFSKSALFGAGIGGGLQAMFRWGFVNAIQNNEAGLGTASIPHSMADTKDPSTQGILAMVSIYSHGIICLLSGLVILLTGTWSDLSVGLGIKVISKSFGMYFSYFGPIALATSALLFAYTTILGNSYNGSQCYGYLTENQNLKRYYFVIAALIFIGAISSVKFLWVITDFFAVAVALPNIIGILILALKNKDLFKKINP